MISYNLFYILECNENVDKMIVMCGISRMAGQMIIICHHHHFIRIIAIIETIDSSHFRKSV